MRRFLQTLSKNTQSRELFYTSRIIPIKYPDLDNNPPNRVIKNNKFFNQGKDVVGEMRKEEVQNTALMSQITQPTRSRSS